MRNRIKKRFKKVKYKYGLFSHKTVLITVITFIFSIILFGLSLEENVLSGGFVVDIVDINEQDNTQLVGLLSPADIQTSFAETSFAIDAVSITECMLINQSGSYTLTSSITSTGTCININASDVILDCNRYNITYGTGGV